MIYLLTAIVWTSVGSSKIHIYTQTIHIATQLYTRHRTEHNLISSHDTEIIKIFPAVLDAFITHKPVSPVDMQLNKSHFCATNNETFTPTRHSIILSFLCLTCLYLYRKQATKNTLHTRTKKY